MEEHANPAITIGPVTFDLTILAMSTLAVLVVFGFVFWTSRQMKLKPTGKQNVLEYVFDFIYGVARDNLGEHYAKQYMPFLFTMFGLVLVANNLGLITHLQNHEGGLLWTSPTANMAYCFALSLIVAVFCHFEGLKEKGLKGYLHNFLQPMKLMLPMNLLEEVTNVVSLALRLYGNIYAGEIVIGLLLKLAFVDWFWTPISFVLLLVWLAFSVFISSLQAYVFTLLSAMYIGKKVNGH
ncbi:F0F1 ATP synthase subunit A [Streptococcus caprae]|uniref:ATP synthase subunit a n=1 Tax=Streptococcus caprae TaxID=1640501 RepID=A0ABV8CSZ6_9STRE